MATASDSIINNLRSGEFVDFQNDAGKWVSAKVIQKRDSAIELRYITFKSPTYRINHSYRTLWFDIELRCLL